MKAAELTGRKFGRLTVVRRAENSSQGQAQWEFLCEFGMLTVIERAENVGKKVAWLCRCDCGNTTRSTTGNLTLGLSASCGCVRTKHLGKGTRLYRILTGMKDRCLNPASKYWSRYGGKGITICREWIEDFSAFRAWALANGYADDLTIDRIDNSGDYCPENCRWITRQENSAKGARC